MARLTNKNILITGGNSGIGLAAAQEFDREGAHVAICCPLVGSSAEINRLPVGVHRYPGRNSGHLRVEGRGRKVSRTRRLGMRLAKEN